MQDNNRPPVMPAFKRLERDGWHEKASFYDDRAGRLTRQATQHLLDAVSIQPGMRLLDVCCGPGYGAGEAVSRGAATCGIDLAPAMIEEARRRFPRAEFREGDAEALDFPDASFDAVICPFGLLHLGEPDRAIAEAFRVLRPGGRYAFSVWCMPEKAELLGMALKVIMALADMNVPLPPAPSFFQFSDPAVAKAALERAGFEGTISEEVPIVYRGNTVDDVWDWFEKSTVRTMALVRLQTPEIQTRIKDGIFLAAKRYETGDGVRIPCPAILHSARKPSRV
jgi:ubiquinone/menaquinone biosynthesis C-methylase UbiE